MRFVEANPGPEGELKTQRVQDTMINLCENLKDRFAILDCPKTRDVEQEILNLHQYRKLGYDVAGSLVQLTLPCSSADEYIKRIVG